MDETLKTLCLVKTTKKPVTKEHINYSTYRLELILIHKHKTEIKNQVHQKATLRAKSLKEPQYLYEPSFMSDL